MKKFWKNSLRDHGERKLSQIERDANTQLRNMQSENIDNIKVAGENERW